MQAKEHIEINIKLSSTFWKLPPKAKIYVDDNLIFDDLVKDAIDFNYATELTEGEHLLVIELCDKDKYQTVVENDQIVKDQLLNIDAISFDEIEIGFLRYSLSKYYPTQEDAPQEVTNCVNLGWNGRWELKFTTPIYLWLLEHM